MFWSPAKLLSRQKFAAALRILQEGHIAPEELVGSWAGAFGQTQFMPSTFRSAVDFDGDGRRDIVDSVPDALASTAKFLQNAGYRREPWGFEVRLPPGLDTSDASRKNKRPIDSLAQRRRDAGRRLAAARQLAQRGADDSGAGRAGVSRC